MATPLEVHLVGPLPPPYGGVSVHVSRLRERLLADGHAVTVWGTREEPEAGLRRLGGVWEGRKKLRRVPREAILHFHENFMLAGLVALTGRHVIFTMHNERINSTLAGGRFPLQWGHRTLSRMLFRRVPRLIAISPWVKRELIRFGFRDEAISVASSYLRPGEIELAHPANEAAFAEFRARLPQLVTTCAWSLEFNRGEDLYGIDLCVEMLGLLRASHPGLGLVLVLPNCERSPYLKVLQARAAELDVAERVLWLHEPGAYHPLQRRCELFIRATNTDGFGVSIAEAMEFGVPVLASDAVPRAAACVLFRNRDAQNLAERVRASLARLPELRAQTLAGREPDHYAEIAAVYRDTCVAS